MKKTVTCLTVLTFLALNACGKPGDAQKSQTPSLAKAAHNLDITKPMRLKPGLWQMTQTIPSSKNGSEGKMTLASKVCIDEAMSTAMTEMNQNQPSSVDCSQKDIHRTPTGADIHMVCLQDKTTITSNINVEYSGDTAYHQTMSTDFSPALAGRTHVEMVNDGKWLSTCPAEMRSGDMIMQNGMKINMNDAMKKTTPKEKTAPKPQ